MTARELRELRRRAWAAWKLVRAEAVDPLLALSYVVWPDTETDDPRAGVAGVDRRHEAAA